MSSYIYLHTADMDERTLYSFEATSTKLIQNLMKDAIEECDRITQQRRCEMNTYEDDDMYDEINNWVVQASEELTRRGAVVYTKPKNVYIGGFTKTSTNNLEHWDKDMDMNAEDMDDFTLPPVPIPEDETTLPKKNSLPTLDEYDSMNDTDQSRWRCLHCCRPALEGSAIPGSFCSSTCALHKYS